MSDVIQDITYSAKAAISAGLDATRTLVQYSESVIMLTEDVYLPVTKLMENVP